MIAYADTGFLVSLYGQDNHSAAATALVRSKPVFILTALGEAEFGIRTSLAERLSDPASSAGGRSPMFHRIRRNPRPPQSSMVIRTVTPASVIACAY